MCSLIVSRPLEPATGATEGPYAVTEDGRDLTDQGRAPAALLPLPRGAGAEVVAVVPSQALAWHEVDLPKGVTAGSAVELPIRRWAKVLAGLARAERVVRSALLGIA